jgi:hypothetical protein
MKKIEKAKGWIKDHKEDLTYIGFMAGLAVVQIGIIVAVSKAVNNELAKQELQDAAMNQKLSEAASRGATILPGGPDGFWIIENTKAS